MLKSSFSINYGKVINDNYVGSCGVYHGFAYQQVSEARGMTEKSREREFARVNEMKLNVARTWYRPDYSQDMTRRFITWMKRMKELNVDIALQAGWWFTKDIWYFAHENYNNREYTSKLENFDLCCDKLAAWISKSLEYFIDVHGLTNIKYLVLFTEPTSYRSGDMPEGISDFEAYERCCRKIHNKLIEYGLRDRVKLMGPNGVFTSYDDKQLEYCVEHLNDVIDIYTLHTYSWCEKGWPQDQTFIMTDYDGWKKHADFIRRTAEKTGKPVWTDEYGLSGKGKIAEPFRDSSWYGNYLAMANSAFANGGLMGSFIWLLFDQQYFWNTTNDDSFHDGVHRWGTCYMPGDSVKDSENARPSWYVMQLLSRYMSSKQAKVYEVSFGEGICGYAIENENGRRSFLIVNECSEECEIDIQAVCGSYRKYLYDPAAIKPQPDYLSIESCGNAEIGLDGCFSDRLPAFGVAVYTNFDN